MDIRTQDAIERLTDRSPDFNLFMQYVRERRQIYLEQLSGLQLDIPIIARAQGLVLAFDEVLRIPAEAKTEKDART